MFFKSALSLAFSLAAIALTANPALAHDGQPHGALDAWRAWSLEPGVLIGLGLVLVLYARGWRVMARRAGPAGLRLKSRAWAFVAALAILSIALISPVDALAGQLFWVHMLQHNLLMLLAAPLLALAYPLPALLLGLPAGLQRRLGNGWRRKAGLRAAWNLAGSPPVAWLMQAVLLWAWHAPLLYQQAVENQALHALQHLSFLGSALLFWWAVLHTFRARSGQRGMAVLYLFTTGLYSGLLGALLTFSTRLWYPVYAGRAETWGLSALADQQLAGTIMWVPAGMVYLAAALWLLKSWLDELEAREYPAFRKAPSAGQGLAPDRYSEKETG